VSGSYCFGLKVAEIDVPAFFAGFRTAAAGEGGHGAIEARTKAPGKSPLPAIVRKSSFVHDPPWEGVTTMRLAVVGGLCALAVLSGCASQTGVVPNGQGGYLIAKQAATGFPGLGNLKAEAMGRPINIAKARAASFF
jgi:hypothetical protein